MTDIKVAYTSILIPSWAAESIWKRDYPNFDTNLYMVLTDIANGKMENYNSFHRDDVMVDYYTCKTLWGSDHNRFDLYLMTYVNKQKKNKRLEEMHENRAKKLEKKKNNEMLN